MRVKRNERGMLHVAVIAGVTVAGLAMAALLGVVLPVADSALGSEAAGTPRAYTEQQIDGRTIYIREGCFTCHTKTVRDAEYEQAFGPMSLPGDYGNEAPNLMGLDRIGPDLSCVGDRQDDTAKMVEYLRRPRAGGQAATMPAYAFLSDRELQALASYLTSLTCGGEA